MVSDASNEWMSSPLSTFHTMARFDAPPAAKKAPSAENATEMTVSSKRFECMDDFRLSGGSGRGCCACAVGASAASKECGLRTLVGLPSPGPLVCAA